MRNTLTRRLERLEIQAEPVEQFQPQKLSDEILELIYGLHPKEKIPQLIREDNENFDRQKNRDIL